jgi:hypothetical protein
MLSLPAQEQARLDRWRLQSIARSLLIGHRVGKCYRVRRKQFVSINYATESKRAFYGGLCVCGSVWACPVCSSKITERRKLELSSVDWSGFSLFMVTVTIQHKNTDSLKELSTALGEAWRATRSGRWYKDFKKDNQIVGSWSGQEVTYGMGAGWHPHKHILFVSTKKDLDFEAIKIQLHNKYMGKLKLKGHYVSFERGIDVREVDKKNVNYVAKFLKEITKSNVKRGHDASRLHPFDLLDSGNDFYLERFREYVEVFQGSSQLRSSPGMRALLGLGVERTDLELAESDLDLKYHLLAQLSPVEWKIVLKKDLRGQVLEVASHNDLKEFREYIRRIKKPFEK